MADMILTAAAASRKLWGEDMEFTDLGEDIAIEARLALRITDELTELDHRIDALARERDRNGSITSAPGVGAVSGAIILGRLGDPGRFRSLAAVRSFSGLVPSLDSSGISSQHGGPTMHGDALLREALFISADQACRQDPTLAVKYHRLMVVYGKHHNTAIPHIAATLLTRIAACWNANTPYELRDVDGTAVTLDQGRAIIQARYTVPESLRRSRTTTRRSRRSKESPSAPSTGPSRPQATQRPVA